MNSVIRQDRIALSAVLGFLAIAFVVYASTFQSMVTVWLGSNTFLHGMLILPLSIYLIWRDRGTWMSLEFRQSGLGLIFLVGSVSAWLMGTLASVQIVSQFAFIGILVAIVWSVLGTQVARFLHFPLLFAFFAVPFGEFMIPKLMDWTANYTVLALQLTGIPVLREGNYFSLPSGNFRVIEACSGIRFLIVTIVLGLYFAHENYQNWGKRGLFLLAAVAAIIGANWVRAYIVVLVAHFTELKYGTGQDHIYIGWFVFLSVITVLFWIGRKYEDTGDRHYLRQRSKAARQAEKAGSGAIYAKAVAPALVLVALFIGPLLAERTLRAELDSQFETGLPLLKDNWVGPNSVDFGFAPGFSGATRAVAGQFHDRSDRVEVFIHFYSREQQGSELIGWRSRLVRDELWQAERNVRREIRVAGQRTMEIRESLITDGRRFLRAWYWYDIGGRQTADARMAKFQQAWNAVLGRHIGDAAVVILAPESESRTKAATEVLSTFVMDNLDSIEACLRYDQAVTTAQCALAGP